MPRAERPPVGSAQPSPSQILHHPERMVQAHGVLLVVAEPHGQIVQVSENLPGHLGWSLDDIIGHGVDRLGPELAHAVRHWAEAPSLTLAIPRRVRLTTSTGTITALATMHRPGTGSVLVELEDIRKTPPKRTPPLTARLTAVVTQLSAAHSIAALADLLVTELRDLTGFERVVLQRWDVAGHAEVIAESRRRTLVAHLHRRVPAHAGHAAMRAHQLRQRTQLSVDLEADPVAIHPPIEQSGRMTDLTAASLLAVPPAERAQLRADGVGALFDVSLLHEGRVWGLLHCTHTSARYLTVEVRAAIELLAEVASTRISALEHYAEAQAEVLVRRLEHRLIEATSADGDWQRALFETPRQLLQPLGATGAALRFDGEIHTTGEAPAPTDLQRLFAYLDTLPMAAVFATAAIGKEHPPLAGMSRSAAGVLAVRIGAARGEYLAWFRREQPHDVTWTGANPSVAPAASPAADPTWREHIRETALPWRMRECAIAKAIGASVADIVTQLRSVRVLIAERQLMKMHGAVEAMDEPVVITDADGDILLINSAVGRLIGGPHRQLQTLEDLAAAFSDAEETTEMLGTLLIDRRPWRGEVRLAARAGDAGTPVAVRADPIPGVDGGLLGVIVMLTDLSERHGADVARDRLQRLILAAQRPGGAPGDAPPAPPTVQALVSAIWANAGVAVSEIADSADAASIAPLLQEVEAATEHAVRLSAILGRFTLDPGPIPDGE
ncbi:MAG: PAS domain-containing protein [Gemmatimonadetes bacterium]|nr:PAS domain-containing protein [Gemmatimonadota bacterium]